MYKRTVNNQWFVQSSCYDWMGFGHIANPDAALAKALTKLQGRGYQTSIL